MKNKEFILMVGIVLSIVTIPLWLLLQFFVLLNTGL